MNLFHFNDEPATMMPVPASSERRTTRIAAAARRREPVQVRSRQRIETILDVAGALVDEVGANDVTTTLVAERAGISVGSIYTYFDDRAAIFNAIVERSILKHGPLTERIRNESKGNDWFEVADTVIDAIAELYRGDPGFRSLYFSSYLSAEMLTAMRRSDEQQAAWLVELLREQRWELDSDDPRAVMRMYVGIIDKGMELAFSVDPLGDDRTIAETKRAIRHYLRPYMTQSGKRAGPIR